MYQRNLFFTSIGALIILLAIGFTTVLMSEGKYPFVILQKAFTSVITDKQLNIKLNNAPLLQVARIQGIEDYLARSNQSFEGYCNRQRLNDQFACALTTGKGQAIQNVFAELIDAPITPCTAAANANQTWRYALMISQLKDYATKEQWDIITARLTESLEQCLTILDGIDASLWHGRFSLGAEAFIVASALFNEGDLLKRAFYHFNQSVMALAMTEGWPSGYNYWIQNRGLTFYLAVQAYLSKGTDESYKQRLIQLARRNGLWHIYMTRPDGRIQPTGDEGSRIDLKDETQKVIHLIAKITRDPAIATYADYLDEKWTRTAYYPGYYWLIPLVFDPDVDHLNTKNKGLSVFNGWLPNQEIFGKNFFNQIVLRTGWGVNDTYVLINGGDQFSHHQHADAGHFTYFAKGKPIVVDAAYYDGISTPNRLYYGLRSTAKNTLNIEKSDTNYQPTQLFKEQINDGSQKMYMPHGSAIISVEDWVKKRNQGEYKRSQLLSFMPGSESTATFDLTSAYLEKGLEGRILRSFHFSKDGTLTVEDKLTDLTGIVLSHLNLADSINVNCYQDIDTQLTLAHGITLISELQGQAACHSDFAQRFQSLSSEGLKVASSKGQNKSWYEPPGSIVYVASNFENGPVKIVWRIAAN